MTGQVLKCDHDGCENCFPSAPRPGHHWRIRTEAREAGWETGPEYDPLRTGKDYCPEHAETPSGSVSQDS